MMKFINPQQIKERLDIVEFLKQNNFAKIQDDGDWVKALCPYHEDTDPSFCMKKGEAKFHCWACKEYGDVFKLLMDLKQIDFKTAIKELASFVGLEATDQSQLEYLAYRWLRDTSNEGAKPEDQAPLFNARHIELNEWASNYMSTAFVDSLAQSYLASRGFDKETATKFGLGFYPYGIYPSNFIQEAKENGFTDEELATAGFIDLENGWERFSERLMFPIYSIDKKIVAFSGRALKANQDPKYTATPNSEFYKKGFFLYGLQYVESKPVVLVEGNLDYIRLRMNGINTLAQLGSILTPHQCQLLKNIHGTVVLLYDGDEAGVKASYYSILPLVEKGVNVRVATMPTGYDPDTLGKTPGGLEQIKQLILSSVEGIKFYSTFRNKPTSELMIDCLKSLKRMQESEEKLRYVQSIAESFGLSESIVRLESAKV